MRVLRSPFLWLTLIVFATAWSAVAPIHRPRLPGLLHFAVVGGEAPTDLERSLRPLAEHLGRSVRRGATFDVVDPSDILSPNPSFDAALVPARFAEGNPRLRILAWAKPCGSMSWRSRLVVVRRRGAGSPLRVAVGDTLLFGPRENWRTQVVERLGLTADDVVSAGPSPYSHRAVLVALGMGRVDAAIVHGPELRRALEAGWVDQDTIDVELLDGNRPWMALVAAPTLSQPAADALRVAALSLDHYRLDPSNGPAGVVVASIEQVGIGGFSPIEPFPSLRH